MAGTICMYMAYFCILRTETFPGISTNLGALTLTFLVADQQLEPFDKHCDSASAPILQP